VLFAPLRHFIRLLRSSVLLPPIGIVVLYDSHGGREHGPADNVDLDVVAIGSSSPREKVCSVPWRLSDPGLTILRRTGCCVGILYRQKWPCRTRGYYESYGPTHWLDNYDTQANICARYYT
jgi:hypothetical protein